MIAFNLTMGNVFKHLIKILVLIHIVQRFSYVWLHVTIIINISIYKVHHTSQLQIYLQFSLISTCKSSPLHITLTHFYSKSI